MRTLSDSLTSKAEVQRLPPHGHQPSASPPTIAPKANSATGAGRAKGAPSPGSEPAHARGGLSPERPSSSTEREPILPPVLRSLARPQPTSSHSAPEPYGRPPPPGGPNAFGQRGAPHRKWPLRPGALVRGKRFLLLTASKIASRFSKAPAEERTRSGAVKRRPPACVAFLSLICQTPSGKVSP